MTKSTRKISIRLDASLHDQLRSLADIHSNGSLTGIIEKVIVAGLSNGSTAKSHTYLEAAVANLAVVLDQLRTGSAADIKAIEQIRYFYGILLELTIAIEGVEP